MESTNRCSLCKQLKIQVRRRDEIRFKATKAFRSYDNTIRKQIKKMDELKYRLKKERSHSSQLKKLLLREKEQNQQLRTKNSNCKETYKKRINYIEKQLEAVNLEINLLRTENKELKNERKREKN